MDDDWGGTPMSMSHRSRAAAQTHVLQLFEASSRLDVEGTQAGDLKMRYTYYILLYISDYIRLVMLIGK